MLRAALLSLWVSMTSPSRNRFAPNSPILFMAPFISSIRLFAASTAADRISSTGLPSFDKVITGIRIELTVFGNETAVGLASFS